MQRIDPADGELLHRSELKPYSQYLDCGKQETSWVLQTLTNEAAAQLIDVPGLTAGDAIYPEHKDLSAPIAAIERETLSPEPLLHKTFLRVPNGVSAPFFAQQNHIIPI